MLAGLALRPNVMPPLVCDAAADANAPLTNPSNEITLASTVLLPEVLVKDE